jgi:hypothetical protein
MSEPIDPTDIDPPAEPTYTIRMPGEFTDWFGTTRLARGLGWGPIAEEVHQAWQARVHRPSGQGPSYLLTATAPVLDMIRDATRAHVARFGSGNPMPHGPQRGCRTVIRRITETLNAANEEKEGPTT